jgi:hypothetical protein
MAKLRHIRELGLPGGLFPGLAREVLMVYRNRASIEEPSRLRRIPPPREGHRRANISGSVTYRSLIYLL